ncbi:MAG: hypothetical protein ACI8TX_002979 [Hyphomicrobiaceae bacterium]
MLSHPTEDSILSLSNTENFPPFSVGGRTRQATCSGVAWFRGYHLAVVNLYGCHLRVYRFHPHDLETNRPAKLELLQELNDGIDYPETVAVSPDGNMLAVAHCQSRKFGMSLFPIDQDAPRAASKRRIVRREARKQPPFHGASFTPDSRHLAYTEIGEPGYVEVVRVDATKRKPTCHLTNGMAPLKPKSVAFSPDAKFAASVMGYNGAPNHRSQTSGGMLLVHRFDADNGVIEPQPIAQLKGPGKSLATSDMGIFIPTAPGTPYRVVAVDQAADARDCSHHSRCRDPADRGSHL